VRTDREGQEHGMAPDAHWRDRSPHLLAALLVVTGSLHFIIPKPYAEIVPDRLPAHDALVVVSGFAEWLCAAGLVVPRTRRAAGWATAALLVAVFPANVKMAVDSAGRSGLYQALAWARLPVQVPLVAWAVSIARRSDDDQAGVTR
jgi:uncharacterized membrane protein